MEYLFASSVHGYNYTVLYKHSTGALDVIIFNCYIFRVSSHNGSRVNNLYRTDEIRVDMYLRERYQLNRHCFIRFINSDSVWD